MGVGGPTKNRNKGWVANDKVVRMRAGWQTTKKYIQFIIPLII